MNLLLENRVSDASQKYGDNPNLSKDLFDVIIQGSGDIAGNQKYLDWIISRWLKAREENPETVTSTKESVEEVIDAVRDFDKTKNILDIKNLYDYKTIDQLFDVLRAAETRQRREVSSREDANKIFENDQFVIMVPETQDASCYYGSGTKWCTAQSDSSHHFDTYKKSGEIYYIIDKTKPTSDPTYKVALNKKLTGEEDFWNAVDKMITDKNVIDSIVHDGILMKSIRDHFAGVHGERAREAEAKRIEREKQRQIDNTERRQREQERVARLGAEAQVRRENNEWEDYDLAHALMTYLVEQGDWEGDSKEDIQSQIDDLRDEMENDPEVIDNPDGEQAQAYGEDLNNLEEDLENAEDVYELIPGYYDSPEYAEFEYGIGGMEFIVATDDGADEVAYERLDNLLDDIGYEGFNPGFLEGHLDGDAVADYFEDWWWEDVNDRPEDYLDDDDRELSKDAEDRLDDIDEEIGELQEHLEEVESESDEEEILGMIEELEERKEEISEDDDNFEYTEEAKENYVNSRKEETSYDPIDTIREYGMEDRMDEFIDRDEFIEEVINTDGRGHTISSYDGEEDEVEYDGEWYYIYRTN